MAKEIKVNIVQDPDAPIEKNILAQAIIDISASLQKLSRSGLTTEAIIILAHENTRMINGRKVTKSEVREVIASLERLRREFVR